jgi:hypothetical protein
LPPLPSQTAALVVRELGLELLRQGAREGLRGSGAPSHRSAIALEKVETMSVALTREESAETAVEVELPDRAIRTAPATRTKSKSILDQQAPSRHDTARQAHAKRQVRSQKFSKLLPLGPRRSICANAAGAGIVVPIA